MAALVLTALSISPVFKDMDQNRFFVLRFILCPSLNPHVLIYNLFAITL